MSFPMEIIPSDDGRSILGENLLVQAPVEREVARLQLELEALRQASSEVSLPYSL